MFRHLIDYARRRTPRGFHPLVVFLCLSAVGLFAHLTGEMLEGETAGPDRAILLAFRVPGHLATPIGPPWLEQSMIDISALGGFTFIWLFTIATLVFLTLERRWRTAGVFAAAVIGASVLNAVVKLSFHRARPEVTPHLTLVDNASFPSGHAMIAAATYLTVGVLLADIQRSPVVRVYLVTLFVAVVVLIGISRLYLGVHWPSDVLAGWLLGAAWALVFWGVARKAEVVAPPPA